MVQILVSTSSPSPARQHPSTATTATACACGSTGISSPHYSWRERNSKATAIIYHVHTSLPFRQKHTSALPHRLVHPSTTLPFHQTSLTLHPSTKTPTMASNNPISALLLVIITIFRTPLPHHPKTPILYTDLQISSPSSRRLPHRRLWRRPPHQHLSHTSWVCPLLHLFFLVSSHQKPNTNTARPCSFFPGHVHAFYLEYVYFDRRSQSTAGGLVQKRAPGVYSERIQGGGQTQYGTVNT